MKTTENKAVYLRCTRVHAFFRRIWRRNSLKIVYLHSY